MPKTAPKVIREAAVPQTSISAEIKPLPSESPKQKKPQQKRSPTTAGSSSPLKTEKRTHKEEPQKPIETKGDAFIAELSKIDANFIDNRQQSGVVWVLYSAEIKEAVESIIAKYKYRYRLEKRVKPHQLERR